MHAQTRVSATCRCHGLKKGIVNEAFFPCQRCFTLADTRRLQARARVQPDRSVIGEEMLRGGVGVMDEERAYMTFRASLYTTMRL